MFRVSKIIVFQKTNQAGAFYFKLAISGVQYGTKHSPEIRDN